MIVEDRADTCTIGDSSRILDLVVIGNIATVTDQNSTSKLLVEHEAHLGLEPNHNIEVGDVNDIVTIELLLLVNRARSCNTLRDAEPLFLFQRSLYVALCPRVVEGDVSDDGLDTREGRVPCSSDDT